jgi:hypothetical protein
MWNAIFIQLLLGCSTQEVNEKTPTKEKANNTFQEVNLDELEQAAEKATVNLVPPPLELLNELQNQGLKSDLSSFVGKKDLSMKINDTDQIALRAGVLISDLVFTIKTASVEDLNTKLDALKIAFTKLKAGSDIGATIDDLKESLGAEKPDREKILDEMNDLSMVMVAELKYEAGEWVVPLIQAGSWLEGSYIISSAILKENNQKATELLKKPGTAKYFLRYVNREGRSKAPPIVIKKLSSTLLELDKISKKKEINMEDVKKVQSLTGELMSLL